MHDNGVFDATAGAWEPHFRLDLEYTWSSNAGWAGEDHQADCSHLVPSPVFHRVISAPIVKVGPLVLHACIILPAPFVVGLGAFYSPTRWRNTSSVYLLHANHG